MPSRDCVNAASNVLPESGPVPGGIPVLYISLSSGRNKFALLWTTRVCSELRETEREKRERERERARAQEFSSRHRARHTSSRNFRLLRRLSQDALR
ncbi:hypothetical protein QQF64_001559 [Cirrhinus molitorella]|uniref:Uncharacterized protein n=1 Tax=Cirrhinus molitorella TaxID=172907 RepID=A0ABR3P1R6_9TELE